ncbi:hypothetical protein VNO78_24141 [Psophocarpus tetragonolobus]|uniref:Uncharacterized protein n=1 Tax=Psophocarpus tetragonolobus TaxID=3891 RepID=A0AAN9XEM0_PSOTE
MGLCASSEEVTSAQGDEWRERREQRTERDIIQEEQFPSQRRKAKEVATVVSNSEPHHCKKTPIDGINMRSEDSKLGECKGLGLPCQLKKNGRNTYVVD